MFISSIFSFRSVTLIILCALPAFAGPGKRSSVDGTTAISPKGPAVLWQDPGDTSTRNLYFGPGGQAHQPCGPFTFESEDLNGSNPKFVVHDRNGVKWTVKLGDEAQPETAASRLVWAVGYFANEDYLLPTLRVLDMPRLRRGQNLISRDGSMHNARLKRHLTNQKKIGNWSWSNNPFTGTHEWYTLRVLMAVINNWDLKDSNTAIYQLLGDHPEQQYTVTDLGSSFGSPGLNWAAKGNLKAYQRSTMIDKTTPDFIDFRVPATPRMNTFVNFPELMRRLDLRWIGKHIPKTDVQATAKLLNRLSSEQIRDMFRAANYSPQEVDAFSRVLEDRIKILSNL